MQMSLKVLSDPRRLEKYINPGKDEYRLSAVFWNQKSSVWWMLHDLKVPVTRSCVSATGIFSGGLVTKQKIACAVQRAVISCVEMQNDWDSLQVMVK